MKKISSIIYRLAVLCGLLFITSTYAQTTYTSVASLISAVQSAANNGTGGTFILQNGTYNNVAFSLSDVKATAAAPIIIKAQNGIVGNINVGGVIFTGNSRFTFNRCAFITVQGFKLNCTGTSTMVKLSGCNNVRFSRNDFQLTVPDGVTSVKWFVIGGFDTETTYPFANPSFNNRVDHNYFHDKTTLGNFITIDGSYTTDGTKKEQSQNDRIDYNHFKNNGPRATNEQEAVRIGWSAMSLSSGYTTLDSNLFENCDGDPEVVSVKTCDNIISRNTFKGNYGSLSLRHGNRNRVEGNYFLGNNRPVGTAPDGITSLYTGGIRIYGTDHEIINNYFEGLNGTKWDAPITLTQGDAITGSGALSNHFRAERVKIAYNTLVNNDSGIEIGFSNNNNYNKGLIDITIANNIVTGSTNSLVKIVDNNNPGANVTWSTNLMYPVGSASIFANGTNTTNPFSTSQVMNENPQLLLNTTQNIFKASTTTPLYNNAATVSNSIDLEGQARPNPSNPGADHYSTDPVIFNPIEVATVGPDAFEAGTAPTEFLSISAVSNFIAAGETKATTVLSNVSWMATVDSPTWLSISPTSGVNNGSINITATANPNTASRSGVLTITGGTLTRTLTVTQDGVVSTIPMINAGVNGFPVTVTTTQEQVDATRFNYATNTLDKDNGTKWSDLGSGNPFGVLTYDFGGLYTVESIKIATTGTSSKWYFYGIQFSTDGINYTAVQNVQSAAASSSTFATYPFSNVARYVKITGGGNNTGTAGNNFSSISEIQFFGNTFLSVANNDITKFKIYPNPATERITVELENSKCTFANIFSMDGRIIMKKKLSSADTKQFSMDVSNLKTGNYIINFECDAGKKVNSKIITIIQK